MSANETRTRITDLGVLADGDEVVITKGANVLREKVKKTDGNFFLDLSTYLTPPRVRAFMDAGYVVEKITPKPPMPTEPGHYTDKSDRPWLRLTYGEQCWVAWDGGKFSTERAEAAFAPFTPVVPSPAVRPATVRDKDADTWTLRPNGFYAMPDTEDRWAERTLESLRSAYGPLTLPNGDPA